MKINILSAILTVLVIAVWSHIFGGIMWLAHFTAGKVFPYWVVPLGGLIMFSISETIIYNFKDIKQKAEKYFG